MNPEYVIFWPKHKLYLRHLALDHATEKYTASYDADLDEALLFDSEHQASVIHKFLSENGQPGCEIIPCTNVTH